MSIHCSGTELQLLLFIFWIKMHWKLCECLGDAAAEYTAGISSKFRQMYDWGAIVRVIGCHAVSLLSTVILLRVHSYSHLFKCYGSNISKVCCPKSLFLLQSCVIGWLGLSAIADFRNSGPELFKSPMLFCITQSVILETLVVTFSGSIHTYAVLRCAALRCAALRCAALRCTALRCAALHW